MVYSEAVGVTQHDQHIKKQEVQDMLDFDKLERDALLNEVKEAQKDAEFWFQQYMQSFRRLGGQNDGQA